MKPNIPEQLSFQQTCIQLSTNQQKPHKGKHDVLSYSVLAQLIQQSITSNDFYAFESYERDILDLLKTLRKHIDEIIINISRDILKCKYQLGLGLKNKEEINAAMEIGLGQKGNAQNIRCCDVYQIFIKVSQFGDSKISGATIQQKINTLAGNIFTQLTEYIKPIQKLIINSQTIKQQKQVPKKNQTTTRSMVKVEQKRENYYSDQEEQIRPTRQATDPWRKNNSNGVSSQLKKIKELDRSSRQTFTIRLKVLRVIKNFRIKGGQRVQFKAGDETGSSTCVMSVNRLIQPGNTIEVTNCRIYLFKGKISQIQSQKNSVFTRAADIKRVGEDYDFTDQRKKQREYQYEKYERQEAREPRPRLYEDYHDEEKEEPEYEQPPRKTISQERQQSPTKKPLTSPQSVIKIQEIQPDLQNVNIIAQIYKIIGEQDNKIICYLGDQTGVVRAQLPQKNCVKEGNSVILTNIDAKVVAEHILVQFNKLSKVQFMSINFAKIKLDNDVSQEAWVQEQEQDQEADE